MKTAVCFYGQPRYLEKCWPTIKEHVVEPNNADVFAHFWGSHPEVGNPWSHGQDVTWQTYTRDEVIDILSAKEAIVEPQIQFDISMYSKGQCPIFNLYSFLYSLKQVHSLYDPGQYDAIIHCRSDLFFSVSTEIESVDENTMYLEHRDTSGDQFGYSDPSVMRVFSDCFDYFDSLYEQLGYIHAETFFRTHLGNHGINIVPCETHYKICRS
jgi:hypothetical protein